MYVAVLFTECSLFPNLLQRLLFQNSNRRLLMESLQRVS